MYMPALILTHNNDVMHQECNMGENIISTCMSFPGKIKDNMNARKDLAELYNHSSLKLEVTGGKPRTLFCLKLNREKKSCGG
jgi:hypothetical protein